MLSYEVFSYFSPFEYLEELVCEQSENAEHDVQMHLVMSAHPHLPTTKLILETRIHSLTDAALTITPLGRRVKGGTSWPRPFLSMIGRWPNCSETS